MLPRNNALKAAFIVFFSVTGMAHAARADATITTFDPPNSIATYPLGINSRGEIAGWFSDNATFHGFIRTANGSIATIDIAGSEDTTVTAINDAGTIVGNDWSSGQHGFERTADGTITSFDPAPGCNTYPTSINRSGAIAGYFDCGQMPEGFVRGVDGTMTIFDVPVTTLTWVSELNDKGEIIGQYSNDNPTGYLRKTDGTIVVLNVEGAYNSPNGINKSGIIVGYYIQANGRQHGFIMAADGTVTSFDATVDAHVTAATCINAGGTIAGYWRRKPGRPATGFVRDPSGYVTSFKVLKAGMQEPFPASINKAGEITGWYIDNKNQAHGFLRTP